MKILATLAASLLSVAISAQSPLLVQPAGAFYGWNPPSPSHQTFFDMTVNTTITLQALTTPLYNQAGVTGSLEMYITNPGITTFVGNELTAANWSLAASGAIKANGLVANATACMSTGGAGLVLQPGSYGVAIRYLGVATLFRAVATVPQTFSNAELTVTGGAIQYTGFGSSTSVGFPSGYLGWNWYGQIIYQNGVFPHACAENANYGTGCYNKFGSFFQEWTSAAAASTALNGKSLSMIPNGIGGYDLVPGLPLYAYAAPTGAAIQIPATDNGEQMQALTIPFAYPGGVATQFYIHSNGFVSVASNSTIPNNTIPEPTTLLAAPA
ncbi:MAG: hypothetical protein JNN13_20055, partial [Planctomycetes bacterium]|nr:hypothetical protein [Planctomycetota bacterium]